MAGLPGLTKDAQAGLKESLASQSAPPNMQTPSPADRKDPGESTLLDLQRIRRALDVALAHIDEGDPRELLISAMNACMTRLLSRVELTDAVDVLLERCFPLSSETLKQRLQAMFSPIEPPSPPMPQAGGASAMPPGPPAAPPAAPAPEPGAPA